ncbi:MAG: hypothetical protein MUF64_20870 [Polyangiaceae bacterium]|nr:hypothetical protein [Polyangiaceae bacterium]
MILRPPVLVVLAVLHASPALASPGGASSAAGQAGAAGAAGDAGAAGEAGAGAAGEGTGLRSDLELQARKEEEDDDGCSVGAPGGHPGTTSPLALLALALLRLRAARSRPAAAPARPGA